ncbi:hypothetical protein MNBD_GAMMA20-1026, partial [hydrothermal vent metagenome]
GKGLGTIIPAGPENNDRLSRFLAAASVSIAGEIFARYPLCRLTHQQFDTLSPASHAASQREKG